MRGRVDGPVASKQWAHIPGVQMRDGIVGRPLGNEYDGLESGELAWIMGRSSGEGGEGTYITRTAHAGMGFGVDRMQRLASHFYMENYFRAMFGERVINLLDINMNENTLVNMSSELKMYGKYLAGASVLGSVDIPYLANGLFRGYTSNQLQYAGDDIGNPVPATSLRGADPMEGFASGLLTVEKGPFLRGKINDCSAVEMVSPELRHTVTESWRKHTVPRNLGDRLAFDALYASMRRLGMFDWTPDGLILSKLESPSGDPLSSAELDARQAQLFNVAIQGPAITKTWTGNPEMHAMPLDKVFVVIVADISTETVADKKQGLGAVAELTKVWEAYSAYQSTPSDVAKLKAFTDAVSAANNAFPKAPAEGAYAAAVKEFFEASRKLASNTDTGNESILKIALEAKKTTMKQYFGKVTKSEIENACFALKTGTKGVQSSSMTNFRLMRCTSSFLVNNSAAVFSTVGGTGDMEFKGGRCGLNMGKRGDVYTGEYIIGGWCVGTVLDSAASRSVIGSQVRTAPSSMAMNINVNVEWWSGDDLYRRYMDIDGTVQQRGVITPDDGAVNRSSGFDVFKAARKETDSFMIF